MMGMETGSESIKTLQGKGDRGYHHHYLRRELLRVDRVYRHDEEILLCGKHAILFVRGSSFAPLGTGSRQPGYNRYKHGNEVGRDEVLPVGDGAV